LIPIRILISFLSKTDQSKMGKVIIFNTY